jgi:hypothetical protein
LKGILIYIGIYVGFFLLGWIGITISKLIKFYKYASRLNRLEPEIGRINFSIAEEELSRLESLATSSLARLRDKYKISASEDNPSVEQFIRIDEATRRAKRRRSNASTRPFRKRYWR